MRERGRGEGRRNDQPRDRSSRKENYRRASRCLVGFAIRKFVREQNATILYEPRGALSLVLKELLFIKRRGRYLLLPLPPGNFGTF